MNPCEIDILPAVHTLSGCDTTSKIGTKLSALHAAEKTGYDQLNVFGKIPLSEEVISTAEQNSC